MWDRLNEGGVEGVCIFRFLSLSFIASINVYTFVLFPPLSSKKSLSGRIERAKEEEKERSFRADLDPPPSPFLSLPWIPSSSISNLSKPLSTPSGPSLTKKIPNSSPRMLPKPVLPPPTNKLKLNMLLLPFPSLYRPITTPPPLQDLPPPPTSLA